MDAFDDPADWESRGQQRAADRLKGKVEKLSHLLTAEGGRFTKREMCLIEHALELGCTPYTRHRFSMIA